MSKFIALDQLLSTGRPAETIIAQRGNAIVSYAEFVLHAAHWYNSFVAHSGQFFALYFEDSIEFAAALLGLWHAKKTAYLLADNLPATIAHIQPTIDGFAGDFPAAINTINKHTDSSVRWQVLNVEAVSLIVFTSGSTGQPQAIPKTLRQLGNEIQALSDLFGSDIENSTIYGTVSHQHIYGLLFCILLPLAHGVPFTAHRLIYAEDIFHTLQQTSITLITSPAHLKRLPDHLDWVSVRAQLKNIFSSGGPLPTEALKQCQLLLGSTPFEIYGSSETGGIAWRKRDRHVSQAWQPFFNIETKLEGDILHIKSPYLSHNHWYSTSDRAQIVDDGFQLLGRADSIIKIEEKRISLSTIEHVLLQTGLINEVYMVPLYDTRTQLCCVIVLNEEGWKHYDLENGKKKLNQLLKTALKPHIDAIAIPRHFRYVWRIPTNTQGKYTPEVVSNLFDGKRPPARLLASDPQSACIKLDIQPQCPYFKGHFTEIPVLPGVVQIDWAILFGRDLFTLPAAFAGMQNIKFQQVIQPHDAVVLDLTFNKEKNRLTYKFSDQDVVYSSGTLLFMPSP